MTILGPSFVISGLFRGHLLPCWPSRGHLGSILRHVSVITSVVISGLFRGHLFPCWPCRGHFGSISRHFSVIPSEDRRGKADFATSSSLLHLFLIVRPLALACRGSGLVGGSGEGGMRGSPVISCSMWDYCTRLVSVHFSRL